MMEIGGLKVDISTPMHDRFSLNVLIIRFNN